MGSDGKYLPDSLAGLRELHESGEHVFRAGDFPQGRLESIERAGYLRPILDGWVLLVNPMVAPADDTAWVASFWEFARKYAAARFGLDWRLTAAQSLRIHAGDAVLPRELVLCSPGAGGRRFELPFGMALVEQAEPDLGKDDDITVLDGLRVLVPHAALIRTPESFFERHWIDAEVVMAGVRDPADLARRLTGWPYPEPARWLGGAFRRLGRVDCADAIASTLRAAGELVGESDPFPPGLDLIESGIDRGAPIVHRVRASWAGMRRSVQRILPESPGLPADGASLLGRVDREYMGDACQSLQLEGYPVTAEMLSPPGAALPKPDPSGPAVGAPALAARGYGQAFEDVRRSLGGLAGGQAVCSLIRSRHQAWYRSFRRPAVDAGRAGPAELEGYRHTPLYVPQTRLVPPSWESVRDAMSAVFDAMEKEVDPRVSAVLAHWLLLYIQPFPADNGLMARLVTNVILAAAGYPWTTIRAEDGSAYRSALEDAHTGHDIGPLASFFAERIRGERGGNGSRVASG